MWYHYTNKNAYEEIMKEGFKIKSDFGRFGTAVYFTNSEGFGYFGDFKIKAKINTPILELTHKEICNDIFPLLNLLEDEEGIPALKEYVLDKGFKAVSIEYSDGCKELAVYDVTVISIYKKLDLLKEKLTQYNNSKFHIPEYEDVEDELLSYGKLWKKEDVDFKLNIMRANECHSNSAEYWMNYIYSNIDKEILEDECFDLSDYLSDNYSDKGLFIATGYALSKETNTWFQHSFLVDNSNEDKITIIETTPVDWQIYYGIILNPLDCLEFYDNNIYMEAM